jgi:SAM-dependent methyltransferase
VSHPAEPKPPLATAAPWNLVASAYVDEALGHFLVYAVEALRLADLQPSARVLDVAAGPGTISVMAAQAGARVTAIDISAEMLACLYARAEAAGVASVIDVHHGDAQTLPFAAGAFDAAFSMFGLMFFPDRHLGLTEMKRVLTPGGRAIISSWVPFAGPFGELMKAVSEVIPEIPLGGKPPLGSPEAVRAELEAAGFRDVTVETVPYELTTPSFDTLWASLERTNVPLLLLKQRLGDDWATAAPKLRQRVRATMPAGDGPLIIGRGAYLGVGTA